MLQISTGKFYASTDPAHLHETTHRGVVYTNYRFIPDRTQTQVGDLLPAARWGDLHTVICEVTERLPMPGGQIYPGMIASVGPDTLIQDFAAIVSFGLNVICTPDIDLAKRLVTARKPPLGISAVPKAFVPRIFDYDLPYVQKEIDDLTAFIQALMGLHRNTYKVVIRAIERYVTAMHRLGDDLNLAYTLLVASLESLVQGFDNFKPSWKDLDSKKSKAIDKALKSVPDAIAIDVRAAILKAEHAALGRRFAEFTKAHVQSSFFREEAKGRPVPAGRSELEKGLKKAYEFRSKYVHELKPLPSNLLRQPSHVDFQFDDNVPYLTFSGLSRVARHVILEFVRCAPKVEREIYDCFNDYPNIIRGFWDPSLWLGNAEQYSLQTARLFLNGFLSQMASRLEAPATAKVSDLRAVCKKIETLVPKLPKPKQKMPMLLLYILFMQFLPEKGGVEMQAFLTPHLFLFDSASIESLLARVVIGQMSVDWPIETIDNLLMEFNEQRFHKNGLSPVPLFGAAMFLSVAELHRASGNETRARELIKQAVEEWPGIERLRNFEANLLKESLPKMDWWNVLVQR